MPNMSSMNKSELLKNVGKNVQKLRQIKGLSQVDLVGKIEGNIDTTNISRIETGRTNPTIYTLFRISEALGVSLQELLIFDVDEN